MTEAEWLASDDPAQILDILRDEASDRKLRLFACACVWRHPKLVSDQHHMRVLTTAEGLADGLGHAGDLTVAREELSAGGHPLWAASQVDHWSAASGAVMDLTNHAGQSAYSALPPDASVGDMIAAVESAEAVERAAQASLLRDIFGNPFHPVAIKASWLTSGVAALASDIYREKAFDRLPILADALQDAGCDSDDLLTHLRDPTAPHVRGCWALDLVLGKD